MEGERIGDLSLLVFKSVADADVKIYHLANSQKAISYIVTIEIDDIQHHYIGCKSVHYGKGLKVHQWDLEYYDCEDNKPTDLVEDVAINGEGTFRNLVIEHLTNVIKTKNKRF
jgi:hypothetical protein